MTTSLAADRDHIRWGQALTLIALLSVALWMPVSASAQEAKDNAPSRGFQPWATYQLSDIETVGVENRQVMYHVPLASIPPGPGGMGFDLNLNYNSQYFDAGAFYFLEQQGSGPFPYHNLQWSEDGGWFYGLGYHPHFEDLPDESLPCGQFDEAPYRYRAEIVFPDGGRHVLRPRRAGTTDIAISDTLENGYSRLDNSYGDPPTASYASCHQDSLTPQYHLETIPIAGPISYYTVDGTFLRMIYTNSNDWVLYFPDGSRVVETEGSQTRYDRNGNSITISSAGETGSETTTIKDDAGRQITIQHCSPPLTAPEEEEVPDYCQDVITAPDGTVTHVRRAWIRANRTYEQRDITTDPSRVDSYSSVPLVTKIILPEGDTGLPEEIDNQSISYDFDYYSEAANNCHWFQIEKLTLPSGASVEYSPSWPAECGPGNTPNWSSLLDSRLLEKTLVHDGPSDVWHYGTRNDEGEWENYIRAPDGGETVVGCTYGSRSDTPSTRVERVWASDATTGLDGMMANRYPSQEYISVKDVSTGDITKTRLIEYQYDKNGNVREVLEYDWVAPGSVTRQSVNGCSAFPTSIALGDLTLLRRTTNTYLLAAPLASQVEDITESTPTDGRYYNRFDLDPESSYAVVSPLNLPIRSIVDDGGTTGTVSDISYTYWEGYSPLSVNSNWNLQKESRRIDGSSGEIIDIEYTYDGRGNRRSIKDGRDITTSILYNSCGGVPTYQQTIDRGNGAQMTTLDYDCDTGLLGSSTVGKETSNVTTRYGYDAIGRLTDIWAAYGTANTAHTTFEYTIGPTNPLGGRIEANIKTTSPAGVMTWEYFDRLWRPFKTTSQGKNEDAPALIQTLTDYVTAGSFNYTVESNPHVRTEPPTGPTGWTLTKRDRADRVVRVETFDGAAKPAPFEGNSNSTGAVNTNYTTVMTVEDPVTSEESILDARTVTDQQGKSHVYGSDGLGRLVAVQEQTHGGMINPITTYTYDAAGNLTGVTQGAQTPRAFVYDWLGRLKSATNPESGQTTYHYDGNGNLVLKIDARSVRTCYGTFQSGVCASNYDALDRPLKKSYSDGTPTVTYCYDGKVPNENGTCVAGSLGGHPALHLTGVGNEYSRTTYAYDELGRVTASTQTTGGPDYPFTYDWTADSQLAEITYPSKNVVKYCFDAANMGHRLVGAVDGSTTACGSASDSYVKKVVYAPHGGIAKLTLGNDVVETTGYNSRLQPTSIEAVMTETSLWKLENSYCASPNVSCNDNNGNVGWQTITVPSWSARQVYGYDAVNRLTAADEVWNSGSGWTDGWSVGYTYDVYGNRTASGDLPNLLLVPGLFDADNRIDSADPTLPSYDPAGNLTSFAGRTLTYDAENRQTSLTDQGSTFQYFYDGEGRRVKKIAGAVTTVYVYDAMGQLAAEYSQDPDPDPPPCETCYLTADHLGSTRLVTDENGDVKKRFDYFPFGVEIPADEGNRASVSGYTNGDWFNPKFTAKERDYESGLNLDYFGARYFAGAMGRFTSVDPANAGADPSNPQSWNGYSYVNNNPLKLVDPNGQQGVPANLQKMLELLRVPLSKTSGAPKGGLIQLALEKPIDFVLGETLGYPSHAVRNNLSPAEGKFLDKVSSYEKGAWMLGVGQVNAPGIDAVDLDNQVGISLKTASSVNALGRNVAEGLSQVEKAGFYNVQIYVDASTLTKADATGLTKVQNSLGGEGRVTKVVVFTSEGPVTYEPTEEQKKQIELCHEGNGQGGSCQ